LVQRLKFGLVIGWAVLLFENSAAQGLGDIPIWTIA
jgi:hypothetical protein